MPYRAFGMIVCPYTMLAVAVEARIRVMIEPIVARWESIVHVLVHSQPNIMNIVIGREQLKNIYSTTEFCS